MTTQLSKTALAAIALGAFMAASVHAVPIVISSGSSGNAGTENVLFNDPLLPDSGTLVQGSFSGGGTGYIVNFASGSGSGNLQVTGGQATLIGGPGNDPFTSLSFWLSDGATFTRAILNVDVVNQNSGGNDGTIDFLVEYINATGSPFTQTFNVNSNGQNFFDITAFDGAAITQISFSTPDTIFEDASQFRIGGFASAPATNVPDGGATVALLALSLLGLSYQSRRISLI